MPHATRVAIAVACTFALAACASSTPPPTGGDPTPEQLVPITSLEGRAEGYAGGSANVASLADDIATSAWYLGSSVGAIDAEGNFSFELTNELPNGALFTTNADEVAELYGECLTISRSWRTGSRSPEAFTGDDIQTRSTLALLRPVDGDDPAALMLLSFIRPLPADASVVLTTRLPIEAMSVTEAGETEPNPPIVTCGDDVRSVELVQGWYWTAQKVASFEVTLPNGDEIEYSVITRFDFSDEAPPGLRFLAD